MGNIHGPKFKPNKIKKTAAYILCYRKEINTRLNPSRFELLESLNCYLNQSRI